VAGDDSIVDPENERHSEARLRIGHDVASFLRLGIDEHARYRLHGTTRSPATAKVASLAARRSSPGTKSVFGAITAGPTTMSVVDVRVVSIKRVSVGATW
jgi:hypothetical protein